MDLNQLKQILDLVREHDLSEFEIEHDGLRLKIRKDGHGAHVVTHAAPAQPVVPVPARRSGAGTGAVGHRAVGRRPGR